LDINWVPLYDDWDAGIGRILRAVKPVSQQAQNRSSALRSERRQLRDAAAQALREIGPGAKTLALTLIERLKNEDNKVREIAAQALGHIVPNNEAAVPALIESLKDHAGVPTAAAWALGEIGPPAKAAVPALIEALEADDKWIRLRAAQALGKIGPEAEAAVPALIKILKNKNEETFVRWRAAEALEKIDTPEARKAIEEYYQWIK
jgi:HEAT repeat protein